MPALFSIVKYIFENHEEALEGESKGGSSETFKEVESAIGMI